MARPSTVSSSDDSAVDILFQELVLGFAVCYERMSGDCISHVEKLEGREVRLLHPGQAG